MCPLLCEIRVIVGLIIHRPGVIHFFQCIKLYVHLSCRMTVALVHSTSVSISEFHQFTSGFDNTHQNNTVHVVLVCSMCSTVSLCTTSSSGSEETTQLLVDAGADVNARTVEGSTPTMFAAMHGKSRALKALLGSPKIDLSIQDELGNTALHAAVMSQKLPCIIPLLEAGADPCMLNFSLITPLHYSARMGFLP